MALYRSFHSQKRYLFLFRRPSPSISLGILLHYFNSWVPISFCFSIFFRCLIIVLFVLQQHVWDFELKAVGSRLRNRLGSISRQEALLKIGSYGKSKFTNWFITFATKLLPKKDYIKISSTFSAFSSDDLEDGITHCLDPNGNMLQLQVSSEYDDRPEFVSGVMKMARFYGLVTTHFVIFHYKGENLFHIWVFGNNFEEIEYPLSNRPRGCTVNNNFYRTLKTKLDPDEDNMMLGDNFNFFWRDNLNGNRAKVVDPEGNFFYLKLSVDENDCQYVSGGVV